MSAQAKTARADMDPQEEPLASEPVEEKDWRDLAFDARRSITNSERCDNHFMRKVNIVIARVQLQQALEKLG